MKIVKAKLKGQEPKLSETVEPRQAEVVDLMERPRQSLKGAGTGSRAAKRVKPAAKAVKRSTTAARPGAKKSTARGKTKRTRAA